MQVLFALFIKKVELYLKIKALRERIGLTQADFSNKIGLTRSNYSHFERGKSNITTDTLHNIANTVRIDANYFFDEDINANNINGYLDGYLNGYLNQKNSSSESTVIETEKGNAVCKACKDKERTINALQLAFESLNIQVEDLRQDKSRLTVQNEKLQAEISQITGSRKQRSA